MKIKACDVGDVVFNEFEHSICKVLETPNPMLVKVKNIEDGRIMYAHPNSLKVVASAKDVAFLMESVFGIVNKREEKKPEFNSVKDLELNILDVTLGENFCYYLQGKVVECFLRGENKEAESYKMLLNESKNDIVVDFNV